MAKSNASQASSFARAPKVVKRKKKWIRYLILLVLGFGVYQILSGPSGAIKVFNLRKTNANQMRELDSLTQRRAELEIEKLRLQKDTTYIERVARKELGMAKPGEKVFRYMASDAKKENQEKKK